MLSRPQQLIPIGLACFLLSTNLQAKSDYQAISNNFKQQFHKQLKKNGVPGGAFVIIEDSKILKMSTYGKRKKDGSLNVNKDTVFRLASVSKTFAGTLATMLVHEDKFSWEDPLTQYMPEFMLADKIATAQINLGHLIGQSTGLMPNSYDNILNANGKLKKIIPQFSKLTPMCSPGACYSYQNIAFSFIQPVIEQQTGKSYSNLVETRIFTPLKMDTASIGMEAFLATNNRASPHVKTRSGFKKVRVKANYYQVEPAAGVNASITDISKWLIANLGNNPKVLSPQLLHDIKEHGVRTSKELRRREWRTYLKDAHYGKGWRVYNFEGEELVYHAGWVAGYVAEVAYSPRLKIGMAMLLNGESRVIAELGAEFWHKVIKQEKLASSKGSSGR
ncbi:beta-lactamase family protein [Shewanella sp. D64]|uniref:serine hydrolase domain-containing protein n=1 Tax=unclassified Shewanella TaxID=196818 RepID=UPI0022BA3754|nr:MULTISPECIES: serine hydrolase domain-containing protein [unclassified Shewanella]MEC4724343.1 beta-lactamase family protein [Shewanella sp. D64]MEC4738855.1 beta-lactamase family protein [Shewanella sp. E94]WBJ97708.1 beta-lactamase family protein [Shewanella sp. MTB7]